MHESADKDNNNLEQLKVDLATKNLVVDETENEDATNDDAQQNRYRNIITPNEDSEFSFSNQMWSNLLDISTTNDTSKSSNPATNKNEELFNNINQLKDQFKTKTTHIFSAITTRIWDSRQNDGLCKIQNQGCQ